MPHGIPTCIYHILFLQTLILTTSNQILKCMSVLMHMYLILSCISLINGIYLPLQQFHCNTFFRFFTNQG